MKRRTIALCLTGYNAECESQIVEGVYARCMELDINVLTFVNLTHRPELNTKKQLPQSIINGENEIFNLINYDIICGIIMEGETFLTNDVYFRICENAKKHNIPVVDINDEFHDECHSVKLSNENAMEAVIRHLIDVHGLTKINFISGFKGNPQSDERQAAYEKVLSEHNIPIEESRIAYGKFWKEAYDCTAKFMEADEKPQAIVCANDTMAFFAMDYLGEHGYKVPDDIIVTGFDAIHDCDIHIPTLTTVRRAFPESGKIAVDNLLDLVEGKAVPMRSLANSVLVINQSCGCVPINDNNYGDFCTSHYSEINRFKEFNGYVQSMNARFTSCTTSSHLYDCLDTGAKFFGLKKVYICICSSIERSSESYDDMNIFQTCNAVSDEMLSMLKCGHEIPVGTKFLSRDLLPESFLDGDKAVFYGFSPLYFKNEFLGYIAFEPEKINGSGDLFSTWVMNICNNAGSYYMNNELEIAVLQLDNLYIHDPLTGLYNRRGLKRKGYELIEQAKRDKMEITIFCIDIDGLKFINDKFGHAAGDNAIITTAHAIEASMPEDSVCTRTGGDEYCIIVVHNSDFSPNEQLEKIYSLLVDYNSTSDLPYSIGCSGGSYSLFPEQLISLDKMIILADENMYKEKRRRKNERLASN